MSERRRRRLVDDEGEEGESETDSNVMDKNKVTSRPSECESEDERHETDLSEYESAADENGEIDGEDTGSETESATDSEEETETETEGGFTDEEGLQEERQSGDGEEQPEGKPDDDEDKKNPAYVPRKGAFYEHDYRQGDEGPDGEEESQEQMIPKKKLWQDEGKWGHDRYFDEMQAPKSREELIALYGYDIQAADQPPEMPPRKMGGRGRAPRGPRRINQMQDFIPRMAVIDTTEYGKDTVPNLEDDVYVQQYEGIQGRSNDRKRGGRGGSRGRGNYGKEFPGDRTPQYTSGGSSQDARNLEYPSLDEISRQTKLFEDFRNDKKASYSQQRENTLHNQEKRHEDQYQQSYSNERISGSSSIKKRSVDEGDWKSAQTDNRGSGDVRNQSYDNSNYRNNHRGHNFSKSSHQSEFQRADSRSSESDSNTRRGYYDNHHPQRNLRQETGDYKGRDDRGKHRESNEDANNLRANVNDRGDGNTKSSKNVVISNKENVQTINVTITSTTTEKKSYAKERRGKGANRTEENAGQIASSDQRAVKVPSSQNPISYEAGGSSSAASRRYSSQRQQTLGKGNFSGPPPLDGAKFYNPALPPPSFYQREPGSVGPPRSPIATSTPALLPPAGTLPYGLPVSGPRLPPPATAATTAMFQTQRGPPPPSALPAPAATLITPPYLPAGMVYGGGPRVPPPGAPAAFPVPLAYTSPPPTTATGVQQAQASSSQHTESSSQAKKVYRGDIIYYAPELQQPSRTPQKRPKAAIPIVNPQEIRHQKHKEGYEEVHTSEAKKESDCSQSSDYTDCEQQVSQEDVVKQEIQIEDLAQNVTSMTLLPTSSGDNEESKSVPKQARVVTSTNVDIANQESDETPSKQQSICDQSLESDLQNGENPKGGGISLTEIKKEENNSSVVDNTRQMIDEIKS